jgi:hypothetical protein
MKLFFSSLLCLVASTGALAQEAPATRSPGIAVRFASTPPTAPARALLASELQSGATDSAAAPGAAVRPALAPTAQVELSGFVFNENKRPLCGATIMVKGTTIAASTDAAGHYSLLVPPGINTLLYDYMGYEGVEISASNFLPITVTLNSIGSKARAKNAKR